MKIPHLPTLAVDLRRLADTLDGKPDGKPDARKQHQDRARAALAVLLEQSQNGYPTSASGASGGQQSSDEPWTATERAALNPDPGQRRAARTLRRLTETASTIPALANEIEEAMQGRAVDLCNYCGNALPPGGRCQRLLDPDDYGQRQLCEGSGVKTAARSCLNCSKIMATGEPLRAGRCNACRMTLERTGRERAVTDLNHDRLIVTDPAT